jgi:hypothetical protein
LNYTLPDLVPMAVPPNMGYLAQSFRVADCDAAVNAGQAVGATVFTAPQEVELPGRGHCRAALVRNPGSGALQELFTPL